MLSEIFTEVLTIVTLLLFTQAFFGFMLSAIRFIALIVHSGFTDATSYY